MSMDIEGQIQQAVHEAIEEYMQSIPALMDMYTDAELTTDLLQSPYAYLYHKLQGRKCSIEKNDSGFTVSVSTDGLTDNEADILETYLTENVIKRIMG